MLDNFAHKNLPNQELQPNYNFLGFTSVQFDQKTLIVPIDC